MGPRVLVPFPRDDRVCTLINLRKRPRRNTHPAPLVNEKTRRTRRVPDDFPRPVTTTWHLARFPLNARDHFRPSYRKIVTVHAQPSRFVYSLALRAIWRVQIAWNDFVDFSLPIVPRGRCTREFVTEVIWSSIMSQLDRRQRNVLRYVKKNRKR